MSPVTSRQTGKQKSTVCKYTDGRKALLFPCLFGGALCGLLLFEDAVGDLSDKRLGQLAAEFDIVRHCVFCNVLAAVGEDSLFRLGAFGDAGLEHDKGLDLLP